VGNLKQFIFSTWTPKCRMLRCLIF